MRPDRLIRDVQSECFAKGQTAAMLDPCRYTTPTGCSRLVALAEPFKLLLDLLGRVDTGAVFHVYRNAHAGRGHQPRRWRHMAEVSNAFYDHRGPKQCGINSIDPHLCRRLGQFFGTQYAQLPHIPDFGAFWVLRLDSNTGWARGAAVRLAFKTVQCHRDRLK